MTETINYDSLLILSIFAFITPIIINSMKKFKIPFVVGEIFVGIIIGKSFLNLVHEDVWISFLSHLGLAYLLFLSGLEIDFDQVKVGKEKKKAILRILLSFLMFGISLLISYIIARILFNLQIVKNISFTALLFAASAPGLIVPLLKERKILNTEYGQTILIFSLICEFVCLISITFISSTIIYGFSYKNFLFIILFILAFLLYRSLKKFSRKIDLSTSFFSNLHIGVRAAFALILILVTVSNKIGTEIVLGSFLAGIIFSLMLDKEKEELKYELDIIGYGFLIPIYFIMVGVNLDLTSVFDNPNVIFHIPIFLIIIFVVKLIPSLLMTFTYGLNKAISGSLMLSAQLSLMIVGAQLAFNLKLINSSEYSAFILTTVISCILFPLCFDRIFKPDNVEQLQDSAVNKISIMEVVPLNKEIYNKTLQEIDFPHGFRVFLIIRNGVEILPEGDNRIMKGDRLIIAGLTKELDNILSILNGK
ncbi:cation:proton antiporter [Haloimpatiens sp. FM7330]|uniref:cation:proton antiporter n=1 Tax=Haloimpatiens sp. FM7330 TaxID=3298610 RepID=UPI003635A6A7